MFDDPTATSSDLDELTIRAILGSLQQAGAELDRLWLTAMAEGRNEAMQIAEASQALHRALIVIAAAQS
jgi:hypothetical protein